MVTQTSLPRFIVLVYDWFVFVKVFIVFVVRVIIISSEVNGLQDCAGSYRAHFVQDRLKFVAPVLVVFVNVNVVRESVVECVVPKVHIEIAEQIKQMCVKVIRSVRYDTYERRRELGM